MKLGIYSIGIDLLYERDRLLQIKGLQVLFLDL